MGGYGIRVFVAALVSLSLILFLLVGILANSAPTENVKTLRFNGKVTHQIQRDMNLFHVSKRKVPNGPDPIHNRKAETSRRPPRV